MKISNYIEKWKYKIICSLSGFPSTSGKNKTQANKQSYYEQGQLKYMVYDHLVWIVLPGFSDLTFFSFVFCCKRFFVSFVVQTVWGPGGGLWS